MPSFARRFCRGAALLALLVCVALVGALVTGIVLAARPDPTASIPAWAVAAALLFAIVVNGILSRGRIAALRKVARENPDGAVFLGRRQPALVSDLATYLNGTDVYDQVSDRWVVASIDDRGMAAWSVGRTPKELVLMPWAVIGTVERVKLESGQPGVAVDVKPFPTPLVVSVGYAAYGYLGAFGSRGVDEVVATANALRPQ